MFCQCHLGLDFVVLFERDGLFSFLCLIKVLRLVHDIRYGQILCGNSTATLFNVAALKRLLLVELHLMLKLFVIAFSQTLSAICASLQSSSPVQIEDEELISQVISVFTIQVDSVKYVLSIGILHRAHQTRICDVQEQSFHERSENCHPLLIERLLCNGVAMSRRTFLLIFIKKNVKQVLSVLLITLHWLRSDKHFEVEEELAKIFSIQLYNRLSCFSLERLQLLLKPVKHDFVIGNLAWLDMLPGFGKHALTYLD